MTAIAEPPKRRSSTLGPPPVDANLTIDLEGVTLDGKTAKAVGAYFREAVAYETDLAKHQARRAELLENGDTQRVCDVRAEGKRIIEERDELQARMQALRIKKHELLPAVIPFFEKALNAKEEAYREHIQKRIGELREQGVPCENRRAEVSLTGQISAEYDSQAIRHRRDAMKARLAGVKGQTKSDPTRLLPIRWQPCAPQNTAIAALAQVQ